VRLPLVSGRDAARVFERAGFVFDHQRGSHMIYYREADGRHLSIPDHRELGRGLLRKLIKQAGFTPEEFVRLRDR
jgi:predicted RNA binding protein YcfA (HicA-like mRNA interferase family)